jgi:hypothetical protein
MRAILITLIVGTFIAMVTVVYLAIDILKDLHL